MFHPDGQERAWAVWRHSLATGEPYYIAYRLRHRSGQYRWVLGRAHAAKDDAGRIIRWYGTCTDIQDIIEAREVLGRSRDELEHLVERRTLERDSVWKYSRDLQVVVGVDGIIRAANRAWLSILGWEPTEVVGAPPSLVQRGRGPISQRRGAPDRRARAARPLRASRPAQGRQPPLALVGGGRGRRTGLRERPGRQSREAGGQRVARDAGTVAPGQEDGGRRPVDRRPRARLQQPADGHLGQPRIAAEEARPGTHRGSRTPCDRGTERVASRDVGHASIARFLETPDAGSEACRHRSPGSGHGRIDPSHDQTGHRLREGCAPSGVARPGRFQPARERAAEPVHQRTRRHAERRSPDDRGRPSPARRARGTRHATTLSPRGLTCPSASPTPDPACRGRSSTAPSTRSSRRSR